VFFTQTPWLKHLEHLSGHGWTPASLCSHKVGFQLISIPNTLRQQEVCGDSYLITSFLGKTMTLGFLSGK